MSQELIQYSDLQVASKFANEISRQNVLERYIELKSEETIRRQYWDIKTFESYLKAANINTDGIALELPKWQEEKLNLNAWEHVTHGIVQGFVRWQFIEGFAIGSINIRLSTIKTYCDLANRSGILPDDELVKIMRIKGYRHKEGMNADKTRSISRKPNSKKAEPIVLTKEQVEQLKDQPHTPQGWRDKVIICFFLDHGLRCGELAGLTRSSIDLSNGRFHVYREKVDKNQTHKLTDDTLLAVVNYLQLANDLRPNDQLLRGSQKSKSGDKLVGGMSKRAITARVNALGKRIGIEDLSAHDWRHTWGTHAAQSGTDIKSLIDAGGWSSAATPLNRYVQANKIANQGVKLDY